MLHTKYQDSRAYGFRQADIFMFPYISLCCYVAPWIWPYMYFAPWA